MVMARPVAFMIAAMLLLGGCCRNEFGYALSPSSSLAEFSPARKPHHVKRARIRKASNSTVASKEVSSGDDLDDEELRKKLVICRGCDQPEANDQSNSIWSKPTTDSHYLTADEVSRLFPGQAVFDSSARRRNW
jgi:hypothetical protein